MARENQKYQVMIIVSVMINVVLLVTTFLGFRSANDLQRQKDEAQKRSKEAQDAQRQLSSQLQFVLYMIGQSNQSLEALKQAGLQMNEQLQSIEKQFLNDMAQYGEGLPAEQQNYRRVCENLVATIRQKNEALANADVRVRQTLQELNTKVTELTQRLQTAENARQQAEQTLAQEVQKFNAERQRFIQQTQADAAKIGELNQQLSQTRADYEKQLQRLVEEINKQAVRIQDLEQQIAKLTRQTFEIADGKIVTVNQLDRYVWINLGSASGLRPQMIFGVYDQDVTNIQHSTPKASIEVTRVQDAYLAEARIVSDNPRNPIIRGDLIYSPVWRAGSQLHFALAGFMDINNDGISDRQLIKRLINAHNGVVDGEVTETGELVGEVSARTQYLVLGNEPTERDTPEMLKNYSDMREKCRTLGISILRVHELLNLMGWKPGVQTVNLGGGSGAAAGFQPRQPPARGTNGGAF